ncbi:thiamine pyrophosphate-binding protein [Microbacterium sp. TNHR37B]|uniref:thiamine pyrophosphate-binding protein n=1 Tax=Microbacterium sp. TNHR37B TaxID=1775956 RepID=UPI0007B18356|nr:thiamine pyrophosphate-binding protein [Microbacterium sp. TNHR37B]KZE88763.1 2-succinyl-5-enolpyruvyl-6-hydroxy-3-cyclohexene-1-carboxylate synthase [Microbacterium sp. TNHR37B]
MSHDAAPQRAPATDAAAALLGRLVERGVTHVVVSPGSRSQALALVAAELEERGRVRLHVRIDERVAGFTALGIGRETGLPAVVICTSGTAAAGFAPAALEAHHSGVPLILVTADRPPELRGVGANQTTRQPGMYSPNVRWEADLPVPDAVDPDGTDPQTVVLRSVADEAFAAAVGVGARSAGPVHLNVPLREPLSGAIPPWFDPAPVSAEPQDVETQRGRAAGGVGEVVDGAPDDDTAASGGALYQGGGGIGESDVPAGADDDPLVLERGPRTIVVAGADAGVRAEDLAHHGGWPLVAEIVSGARFGRHVVHGYRLLLADGDLGGRVERAVVFGHPTLSREVVALLSRDDVEVIAVRGPGEPLNLNGITRAADDVTVASGPSDREWLGAWMRASRAHAVDLSPAAPDADGLASVEPRRRLGAISAELDAMRAPVDRAMLVDAVWRASWPHDRLLFASSRLVRVADQVLPGKKVPVHSNRGLAGIDGTIATGIGIAVASQSAGAPGVTRVLMGDLAFLHDVGALLLPVGEQAPRIQVIVGNDGGGTIFDGLEVAGVASAAAMDRVLYTPQRVDLRALATAYGWEYVRVETRTALDQALTSAVTGCQVIEVALPR